MNVRRIFASSLLIWPLTAVACNALVNRTEPIEVGEDASALSDATAEEASHADGAFADALVPSLDGSTDADARPLDPRDGEGGSSVDSGDADATMDADSSGPTCPDGGCPTETVASSFVFPADVVVDDTHVYWFVYGGQNQGLEGEVYRIEKDRKCRGRDAGCMDRLAFDRFRITQAVMAPDDVCWTEHYEYSRELICFSKTMGTLRRVTREQPFQYSPAYDDGYVYWTLPRNGDAGGNILGTPITARIDASAVHFADDRANLGEVTARDNDVVWSEGRAGLDGGIFAVSKDGGAIRRIANSTGEARFVAIHGGFVYWINLTDHAIYRASVAGTSAPVIVATVSGTAIDLTVDDRGLAWAELGAPPNYLNGVIKTARHDGSGVRTLAHDQPSIAAITMDATHVYFVVNGTRTANYEDGELRRAIRF